MAITLKKNSIILADNLDLLITLPDKSIDLIYIDPPFATQKDQKYTRLKTIKTRETSKKTRKGFGNKTYETIELGTLQFKDTFTNFLLFIEPRLTQAYRILKDNGSLFVHLDYREAHYVKVLLDVIFGRQSFINEIIWNWDYGAKSKKKWSNKHNTILWYAKTPDKYTFNLENVDRIPYLAPDLVGPEKAKKGKLPTTCWWFSIVGTNSKERTGYPTQKPLTLLKRIVSVHSKPGDTVLDFFAGSGTTGEAAALLGRQFILVDEKRDAVEIAAARLAAYKPRCIGFAPNPFYAK